MTAPARRRRGVRRRPGRLVRGRRHPQRPARHPALGLAGDVRRSVRQPGFWRDWWPVAAAARRLLAGPRGRRRPDRRLGCRCTSPSRSASTAGSFGGDDARPSGSRTPGAATRASRTATPRWWDVAAQHRLRLALLRRAHARRGALGARPRTRGATGSAATSRSCSSAWPATWPTRPRRPGWPPRTAISAGRPDHQPRLVRARHAPAEHGHARHGQPGRRDALAAHRHRRAGGVLGDQPAALTLALAAAPLPGRHGRWRSATSASTTSSTRSRASWSRVP